MFCTKCGKLIPDDSKFCNACGSMVSGTYAPTPNPQPQSGSVYLRPPQHMAPPQPTPGYRPPVRPMTPPPAAPVYQPPVRPMQPPPAAPVYYTPVRPVQPVQPVQPTPVYRPPVAPVPPVPPVTPVAPVAPVTPVQPAQPAPMAVPAEAEPVTVKPMATEPVVNKMPEPTTDYVENIMVNKEESAAFTEKAELATENPKLATEAEESKVEDIINQEATVSEMYIPSVEVDSDDDKTVGVVSAEGADSTLNDDKKTVFYTAPNVVNCEEEPKNSVGKMILKITCAVFAVIFAISALVLGSVRMAYTEDSISGVVDDVNIGNIIDQNGGNLSEFCLDRISDEDMKKLFEQKPFKDYFKKVADEYVAYILGGEKGESISGKTFSELIKNNPDAVKSVSGYEFRSFEYEMIENRLNKSDNFPEIYDSGETLVLRFVFSIYTLIGLIVLTLLCLAGIVIFSGDKRKSIRFIGIILAVIAVLTFAILFVGKLCFALEFRGELEKAIDLVMNKVLITACITCGASLLVGAILFAVPFIGKKKEITE